MSSIDFAFPRVALCRYDHPAFDERTLSEVTAAARVTPPATLRLTGELDFEAAEGVAGVLEGEFRGPRRIDAADLDHVDVARRLVDPLGWDTDPSVQVVS